MSIEDSVSELKYQFPHREDVIDDLTRHLTTIRWPFLLINGAHSTGKSCLTRAMLKKLNFSFSWSNCLEIDSLKSLQRKILYDINLKEDPKSMDEDNIMARVTSNETFICELKNSLECLMAETTKAAKKAPRTPKTPKTPKTTRRTRNEANITTPDVDVHRFFIILDNYEKLVESSINILPALSEIHNDMKDSVKLITIIISTFYYDCLLPHFANIPKPLNFIFPSFPISSLPTVLNKLVSDRLDETYLRYSDVVSATLGSSIGELNKLSAITEHSFLQQINEIQGKGEEVDKKLRKVFLDKVDSYVEKALVLDKCSTTITSAMDELPKSSKYLLISAFLASNNTKPSDKKFFVIASDKRKVTRNVSKKEKVISGPKLFTLERLVHIYEALVFLNESGNHDLKDTMLNQPTNQFLSQIETLVSLKLLLKVNSVTISPLSSLIKYQISDFVTFEFVDALSKSLDISLKEYVSHN